MNIPKVRQGSSVRMTVSLTDNGVKVDWRSLDSLSAVVYSDSQRAIAGFAYHRIDAEDPTKLLIDYPGHQPQYDGIARLIIRCVYVGAEKTYDAPACDFVSTTAEATGITVLTDPELAVDLVVGEVSTSLLDAAISSAIKAAYDAKTAADLANIAANAANLAAAGANDAIAAANEAARAANEAKEHASAVAADVVSAGSAASTAAENAINAASLARVAAMGVDEVKGAANNATRNAITAAQDASTAATDASNAATLANNAAGAVAVLIEDANETISSAERAAIEAAGAAEAASIASAKQPKIIDGYWHVWDANKNQYISTGEKAQGPQGDPGTGGVTPIVNNLESESTTSALSAKQGKVLKGLVDEEAEKVTELERKMVKSVNGKTPDANGNVNVPAGGQITPEDIKNAVDDYFDENPIGNNGDREATESAMGYMVLDSTKTFAEQVTKSNTIYEIRDKFTISSFIMPSNCVLKFNGGMLLGSLIGDNTSIDAASVHIFDDVTFSGTFVCDNVPAEWFGAKAYGYYADKINEVPPAVREGVDSSVAINKALNLANLCGVKATLTGRYYKIENSIIIPRDTTLFVSPHTAICPVMTGSGDSISISDKTSLAITEYALDNPAIAISDQITGDNVTKVVALRENEFITTSAMAKAIVMQPQGSRIEGRGYLLMRAAQYCIGIYMKGVPLESTDMTTASFMDIKITDGSFGAVVHDVVDLYGSGVPANSFGEDGEWYIDITNRVRYKKASGAWSKNPSSQGDAGGQWDWRFNTHVRLEVLSPGSADQRIVNLDAELWSTGGFRGIEMIASPSKSWINSTFWRGTNSNKEGGNYFFFGAGSFADHDFRQMNVQMAGSLTNGYRIIYGKPWQTRFGYVWDLNAGNASLRYKKVIELLPSSAYNEFDCNERTQYVDDQGKYNRWSYLRHHPYQQDDQAVGAFSFYNLLEGRTPLNAKLFLENVTKPNYKTWASPFTLDDYKDEWNVDLQSPVEYPPQLFDCDYHTYSTAIDTSNGLYGVSGLLAYMGASDMNILRTSCMKWLAIEYRLYGASTAFLYIINGERTNTYKLRAEDSLEYKGTGITTQYFPVSDILLNGASYEQGCKIGIAISANDSTAGQILDIVNIRLISTAPRNFRPQYASYMSRVQTSPRFGTTANRPNAVSTGWVYYDTTLAKPVINTGDSSDVIWGGIGGGIETETDPTVPAHVKSITQTNINSWNGKQDTISDLATIRSGAGAGATAVQPSAISDMETKTHASANYQPKGSYATSEQLQTVSEKVDLMYEDYTTALNLV